MYTPDALRWGAILASALCLLCVLVRMNVTGERAQRVSEAAVVGFAVVAMAWWGISRFS